MGMKPAPCPGNTAAWRRRLGYAALALWLGSLSGCQGCGGERSDEDVRLVAWEGTWPVLVLSSTDLQTQLDPANEYRDTWLFGPSRSDAGLWPAPGAEGRFEGDAVSAHIGRARVLSMEAAAWSALATLNDQTLCDLGRNPASYGDQVPEGYLFGVVGCERLGDTEGAAAAQANWDEFSASTKRDLGFTYPDVPWARSSENDAAPEGEEVSLLPDVAHRTVYASQDQDIEYVFLRPDDLHRTSEELRRRAQAAIEACEGCPADLAAFLDPAAFHAPPVTPGGATCALSPEAAMPLLLGTGYLALGHACAPDDSAPPDFFGEGSPKDVADIDGEVEAYLTAYVHSVRVQAVEQGVVVPEAMSTLRELARRGLYRRVGVEAFLHGDNEVALWALENAAGGQWSTTPKGANDPEMLCSLALVRYRAGYYRSAIEILDSAGAQPGWGTLRVLARNVARVEVLPGVDSVGVMH